MVSTQHSWTAARLTLTARSSLWSPTKELKEPQFPCLHKISLNQNGGKNPISISIKWENFECIRIFLVPYFHPAPTPFNRWENWSLGRRSNLFKPHGHSLVLFLFDTYKVSERRYWLEQATIGGGGPQDNWNQDSKASGSVLSHPSTAAPPRPRDQKENHQINNSPHPIRLCCVLRG